MPPAAATTRTLATLALTLILGITPRASDLGLLPEFEVTAIDGTAASSADLGRAGAWLLIYVQPHCQPCEQLLKLIERELPPRVAREVVVIVGDVAPDELAAMTEAYSTLPLRWYADREKVASARMQLAGAPVTLGLRGPGVEWSFDGAFPDSTLGRSILTSWIGQ